MHQDPYQPGPIPAYEPLSVGSLLSTAARATTANIVPFFIIAAICQAPAQATELFVEYTWGPLNETVTGAGMVAHVVSFLVSTLTNALGQAALVFGTVEFLAGRQADLASSVQKGLACMGSVFVLAILMTLGIVLGMLACLVPGLILACGWFIAVPAAVIERLGPVEAMRRSWDLTEGRRGTIFGYLMLLGLALGGLALVAGIAIGGATLASGGASLTTTVILQVVVFFVGTVWLILQSTAAASFYARVRGTRDQIDVDALAEVFR